MVRPSSVAWSSFSGDDITFGDGLPFFGHEDSEVDAMLVWLLVFFLKDLSHSGV